MINKMENISSILNNYVPKNEKIILRMVSKTMKINLFVDECICQHHCKLNCRCKCNICNSRICF